MIMDVFAEAGIKFSIITPDRSEEVCQLLGDNFFPDEPIFRSCGLKRNSYVDWYISEAIKGGVCVMATETTGKIIGVRLNEVVKRNSWSRRIMEKCFSPNLLATIGKIFRKPVLQKTCEVYSALSRQIQFDVWALFERLDCQKVLHDICVCTSRENRVKGLGTELVKQGEAVGRERGCEYSYNMVTGLYSGKIFREKCNYIVDFEVFYAQFIDKNGNLYLNDTREHLSCFSCYKKL